MLFNIRPHRLFLPCRSSASMLACRGLLACFLVTGSSNTPQRRLCDHLKRFRAAAPMWSELRGRAALNLAAGLIYQSGWAIRLLGSFKCSTLCYWCILRSICYHEDPYLDRRVSHWAGLSWNRNGQLGWHSSFARNIISARGSRALFHAINHVWYKLSPPLFLPPHTFCLYCFVNLQALVFDQRIACVMFLFALLSTITVGFCRHVPRCLYCTELDTKVQTLSHIPFVTTTDAKLASFGRK